jgi:hypothetical protein
MSCDFDKDATERISVLQDELIDLKYILLKAQWDWWSKKPVMHKFKLEAKGMGVIQDSFNFNLGWSKNYVSEKVRIYREIFQELNLLTERIDFYAEEDFVA